MKGIFYKLFLALCLLPSHYLLAQVEIMGDDILNLLGQSHKMEQRAGLPTTVTVGPSGPDRVWDFRLLNVGGGSSHLQTYSDLENTPFAQEFPNSNFTIFSQIGGGDYYNYYEVNQEGLFDIGAVNSYSVQGTPYQDIFKGSFMLAPLPLHTESAWQVVTRDTTDYETLLVINRDSTVNEVDGWGMIRIPAGDFDCLRIKSRAYKTEENIFDGESFITSDTVLTYSWITKDAFIVLTMTSLNNEIEDQFTTAFNVSRLAEIDQSTPIIDLNKPNATGWTVFPNPVTDQINIKMEVRKAGRHTIQLLDCNSRLLEVISDGNFEVGSHSLQWQIHDYLNPALYFVRIIAEDNVAMKSIVKVK
ncbi:MAG: hypothetical protein KDC80_20140 [Saprospiraceae bacterium]|nr:hypothetical protein [Saprospiraceae bacterium]